MVQRVSNVMQHCNKQEVATTLGRLWARLGCVIPVGPAPGAAGNFQILVTGDPQLAQAITFVVQRSIHTTHGI